MATVVRWAVGALLIAGWLVVACSDADPVDLVAGEDVAGDGAAVDRAGGDGSPVLQAVLEPADALVDDFGDGWAEVDRWYTEGAMTHWGTGCSGFDRLGDIFNQGTPQTVVWARGDDRLFQRTEDFGWDAAEFADVVDRVPETCPVVEIGSTTVTVATVDSALLGQAAERLAGGDDPTARLVAIELDAYPHPSLETDIATPEFEPGRPAWMVVATRHNVVSQLVYGPAPGSGAGPEALADLVAAQIEALLTTPVEASGPFERAAPPPSVEPGTATDVELFVDPQSCRNDGFVELDGIRWTLAQPIPFEWRERNPIVGDLAMDGTTARFTAHPGPPPVPGEDSTDVDGPPPRLDRFTVELTTGAVEGECHGWVREDDPTPSSAIGRLDCDDRPVDEVVVPDAGQDPLALAVEADPQVVEVQSDGPLRWSGLDGGGRVVVALFLGDTDDPDWQIFTCGTP